ncbi:MAG: multidrug efflux SMR transporter [Chloroflexi bacterium]|nr:multidrug efflux SMR transporter [Chloroflexota bacterium]|tara:strand:- start:343 stop:744 length:402 start_codon:yes stop_codon:yes gene_type:complete
MHLGYIYLFFAIIFEVTGTLMLPISKNFTKPIPSIIIIGLYIFSTYLMTFTLDYFPIGIVYAIWSAMGIAIVAIVSYFIYSQSLQWQAIFGLILIIAGVILLNLFSADSKSLEEEKEINRDTFMEMSDLNKDE